MVEGLLSRKEKPSNTEVLGLLMDEDKLKFISNLNMPNIEGLCRLEYLTERLNNPSKNPIEIHKAILDKYLALKCSLQTSKGNRADQVVDALKKMPEEEKDDVKSLVDQVKK